MLKVSICTSMNRLTGNLYDTSLITAGDLKAKQNESFRNIIKANNPNMTEQELDGAVERFDSFTEEDVEVDIDR